MSTPNPKNCGTLRLDGQPTTTQLVLADHQVTVGVVDFSPDGATLVSQTEFPVTQGQNVHLVLASSAKRFAKVHSVGWFGKEYQIGVTWNCVHHREAACKALSRQRNAEQWPPRNLPAQLYTCWQLVDAGELRVLTDVIDQLARSAADVRDDLVEKCHELKHTIGHAVTSDIVPALDDLCVACVEQQPRHEAEPPQAVTLEDVRPHHLERRQLLGTSPWVLGTATVLAGHVLMIV